MLPGKCVAAMVHARAFQTFTYHETQKNEVFGRHTCKPIRTCTQFSNLSSPPLIAIWGLRESISQHAILKNFRKL
jgi:hypothetical protein